jgi:hypothetical protein
MRAEFFVCIWNVVIMEKNCQCGYACSECVNGKCLKTYDVSLLKGEINNEQSYLIVKRKILTYVIYFSCSTHLPLPIGRRGHVTEQIWQQDNQFGTKEMRRERSSGL